MTFEDREALDLFAVPHVINVRLLKVLAFGRNAAAAAPPFTLRNRKSYHITNWVATALWNVDGQASQEEDRWCLRLNGSLLREHGAEITHTFAEPGMAVMVRGFIVPCLWPPISQRPILFAVLRVPLPVPFRSFPADVRAGQNTFLW